MNTREKIVRIFILITAVSAVLFAQTSTRTSGADFLRIEGSAAGAALGETSLLNSSCADGIFANPAYLSEIWGLSATTSYGRWILESNYARLGLAVPILRQKLVLGAGSNFLDYGSWDNDNWLPSGEPERSAMDFSGRFGVGWRITRLRSNIQFGVGADAEYVYRDLAGASGGGLGLGGGFYLEPFRTLKIAGRADHITVLPLKLDGGGASGDEEDLPMRLEGGVEFTPYTGQGFLRQVDLYASVRRMMEDDLTYGGGVGVNFLDRINLRAGWRSDRNIFAPSAGLGAEFPLGGGALALDYTYTPYIEDLFAQSLSGHRVTLSYESRAIKGFHLRFPIGMVKDACYNGYETDGTWEARFVWSRAGIPRGEFEERYKFQLATHESFAPDRLLIDEILDYGEVEYGRLCSYNPGMELTEGDYYWRVYLVDGREKTVESAPENPAQFIVECEDTICRPPAVTSLVVENAVAEVETVVYTEWDIPLVPVVFFDRNETRIVAPPRHDAVSDSTWNVKTIGAEPAYPDLFGANYYEDFFTLLAERLDSNPDVVLDVRGYSPVAEYKLTAEERSNAINRARSVREGITRAGSGIDGRVNLVDISEYNVCNPRIPWLAGGREYRARSDENRRVEIDARINGRYEGALITESGEVDFAEIREYAAGNRALMERNPDFVLVSEVLIPISEMKGRNRKMKRYNAIDRAMRLSSAIAESIRVELPEYADRIYAWGDTLSGSYEHDRVKVFVSPDRVTYEPRENVRSRINESDRAKIAAAPPTFTAETEYPCKEESRRRVRGWEMRVADARTGRVVRSWGGSGAPPAMVVKESDYRD